MDNYVPLFRHKHIADSDDSVHLFTYGDEETAVEQLADEMDPAPVSYEIDASSDREVVLTTFWKDETDPENAQFDEHIKFEHIVFTGSTEVDTTDQDRAIFMLDTAASRLYTALTELENDEERRWLFLIARAVGQVMSACHYCTILKQTGYWDVAEAAHQNYMPVVVWAAQFEREWGRLPDYGYGDWFSRVFAMLLESMQEMEACLSMS